MRSGVAHLFVVPHTHWDREWYRTREQFRHRLLRVVDGLLELLESDPAFRFTLDGQTIVLDDYLDVRPGARSRIEKLVRAGRLFIGPWTVLPDEWLVSGEALIRNLRAGQRRADALGGAMRVGYAPDQFGHVGQLPQIFAGFGLEGAVIWRGVGADVAESFFCWEAPDGTRLLTAWLPRGYDNAGRLPLESRALADRLQREVEALRPSARIPLFTLMNGHDHAEAQAGLAAALERAVAGRDDMSCRIAGLSDLLHEARTALEGMELPLHRGELRSGLRAPLLPGCASARLQQKRRDFSNDRLLTRYLEPLAAWLGLLGGDPDTELIERAWRLALENHPHDSICGCSIDAVHEEMETRFARVEQLAGAHLAWVSSQLAARVEVPAVPGDEALVVWNPHAPGRAEVDATLEIDAVEPRAGRALWLRRADGGLLPAQVDRVASGRRLWAMRLAPAAAARLLGQLSRVALDRSVHGVRWRRRARTLQVGICLGEGDSGFDVQAGVAGLRRALDHQGLTEVDVELHEPSRVRLRFVDELPGHGLRTYRIVRSRIGPAGSVRSAGAEEPASAMRAGGSPAEGAWIQNGTWRVEVTPEGLVTLLHGPSGVRLPDALRFVSEGDRGDEYNFDPVPEGERVERPFRVRVRIGPVSAAAAELHLDARYRVPSALHATRRRRSTRHVTLPLRVKLRLPAGLDRVDVAVELENTAQDHRLRACLRAPLRAERFEVESAFELARRPIAPPADAFGSDTPAEFPIGATPQRSFASIDDGRHALSVANRGCSEVEALPEPDGSTSLALTLLRAVGWLSRGDLVLRPLPAGPELATPGAQVPGPHRAEFSLRWHAAEDPGRLPEAHRFANPPLAWVGGAARPAPLADGSRLIEVDDACVVVSAIEPRAGGATLVRLFNASSAPRHVRVGWPPGSIRAAQPVDLAERPDTSPGVDVDGAQVRLAMRPWQIRSLLLVVEP